jgi:hypothetical protein
MKAMNEEFSFSNGRNVFVLLEGVSLVFYGFTFGFIVELSHTFFCLFVGAQLRGNCADKG